MRISDWSSDVCSSDLLGGLVAVGMDVHLEAGGVIAINETMHVFRGHVPDAVRPAVEISGPFQPGGEALDRPVGHQLDQAEAELVGRCSDQAAQLGDTVGDRKSTRLNSSYYCASRMTYSAENKK